MKIAVCTDQENEMMSILDALENLYIHKNCIVYLTGYYDINKLLHDLETTEYEYVFLDDSFFSEEFCQTAHEVCSSKNVEHLIFIGSAPKDAIYANVLPRSYNEANIAELFK